MLDLLIDVLPWIATMVLASAYVTLRHRHRLAKAALGRAHARMDELRDQLWRTATRRAK